VSAEPLPPLLFVDVDGPLNPYAAKPTRRPKGYQTHRMSPPDWARAYPDAKPLRVWLNPEHGPMLLSLPVELVWATTWEHDANEWIGPRIGLPKLPVVEWPERALEGAGDPRLWKTQPLADYAAGRPFAWIDDQLTSVDRHWCTAHYPASTLLLPIDPAIGLRSADIAAIGRWARLAGCATAERSRPLRDKDRSTDEDGTDAFRP
jgi:hypothetical protein